MRKSIAAGFNQTVSRFIASQSRLNHSQARHAAWPTTDGTCRQDLFQLKLEQMMRLYAGGIAVKRGKMR
ncbi:unnamed protein product [Protopolystoma xenopodis]|uniref:Uncharacterized protein n=1 Tax=Protopolystoma xenopodis TaxID=117903 RepID=A0A448XAW8_9PLAT|nr:unnamed protein product [Protopolystoma xenopodis]